MNALVIVHPASILEYAEVHPGKSSGLSDRISEAIRDFRGIVVTVEKEPLPTQRWDLWGDMEVAIVEVKKGIRLEFDDATESWDDFLPELEDVLRKNKVRKIVVGGIWFDRKLRNGCATTVYSYLRDRFDVSVDPGLVGD